MTPLITTRSFTNDQYQLDKVFYSNHYKLKGFQKEERGPIVIDIGAHCGYFTFAAVSLGASKVYSFEPFIENYKILLKNIESIELNKVISYQIGVYTEKSTINISYPKVIEGTYYDFANLSIEEEGAQSYPAPCFTLDYILKNLVQEEVDILKINIGYAEVDILSSSELVPIKVRSIVLETLEQLEKVEEFIKKMKEKGFTESAVSKVNEEEGKIILILSKDSIDKRYNIQMKS